ncbi:MAG: alpha/beta hydrolase [Candidatus Solibacter usitatus]|nr:alpha/beta hydrolase [Candidatus Solibacter usitatus]
MARRIESLFLPGPAGQLEALLEEPEDSEPLKAAVVCHPHPLYGGTMHNKVVHRMARGLRRSGHVVLRFNFRGVNRSEGKHDNGVGEVEDARAALMALRGRYPELPFRLAGFSFGSLAALRLAHSIPETEAIIATGFPAHYVTPDMPLDSSVRRVFLHSRHDALCKPDAARTFYESLAGPKDWHWVEASDHFFSDALPQLEELVVSLG